VPPATEDHIREALRGFNLTTYVEQVREVGRAQLSPDIRSEAASLYRQVCEFRIEHSLISRSLDDVLELAHRVLFPEWFLSQAAIPRYRAYTNVGVLNWYLQTVRRTPYQQIWTHCAAAIKMLLQDLLAFEVNSLAGLDSRGIESFDGAAVRDRVARLDALHSAFSAGTSPIGPVMIDAPPSTWDGYVSESGSILALVYLTAFPQTVEHDEYLFLRTIHISECCFWGILTASLAAVESLKRGRTKIASQCLSVALPFAQLLTPLFQALKTMSPEHFRKFRDATGDASAVQSRTYQLMQITLTGVNPDTIKLITGIDELQELELYDQPWFTNLVHLALPVRSEDTTSARDLTQHLDALSKELHKWRTLHLGIARNYLADIPQGTGGTHGPEYLRLSVKGTLEGVTEALQSDVRSPSPRSFEHLHGEVLWPEEHSVARRLAQAQPVLTPSN
jgi:tryptophan 2,3-dioxygenase